MFAIVNIAGFQEKVEEGMKLHVPTLNVEEGKTVTFDTVFLLAKSDTDVKVGTPTVSGASVEVKVLRNGKDKKIRIYKMNRRKRYRRTQGHRQGFTEIEVTKIKASGATKAATATKAAAKAKAE